MKSEFRGLSHKIAGLWPALFSGMFITLIGAQKINILVEVVAIFPLLFLAPC